MPGKNLADSICDILAKYNHPDPVGWKQYLHPDVFKTPDLNVQRFLINRYWRQEIGLYPENTINVRSYLIDQGEFSDWLRLFEEGVVQCVLRNYQLNKIS